jgi:ribose transport system permease protein
MKTDVLQTKSLLQSDVVRRLAAFGGLIVMFIVFSLASPNFFQFSNIVGILLATAVNGVLALGVTFVIITAGLTCP